MTALLTNRYSQTTGHQTTLGQLRPSRGDPNWPGHGVTRQELFLATCDVPGDWPSCCHVRTAARSSTDENGLLMERAVRAIRSRYTSVRLQDGLRASQLWGKSQGDGSCSLFRAWPAGPEAHQLIGSETRQDFRCVASSCPTGAES